MIAAVFDCNIFVQAAISDRGPAAACVSAVEANEVRLFVTSAILTEVLDVLSRPKIRTKFRRLTDERIESFSQRIGKIAELTAAPPPRFSLPRSRRCEYVDLAEAASVKYLVSRDKDLLSLNDDAEFRAAYPGFEIVDPEHFSKWCVLQAQCADDVD